MGARPAQLKKHMPSRRPATLLATVQRLETNTVDDALELLDLLMVTKLFGQAAAGGRQGLGPPASQAGHCLSPARGGGRSDAGGGRLGVGGRGPAGRCVGGDRGDRPRAELRAAVATVTGMVPPPDASDTPARPTPTTWSGCSNATVPTALGEAVNTYDRIHKSLHVLALINDEDLRRPLRDPDAPEDDEEE
jgi:hypothetical protein